MTAIKQLGCFIAGIVVTLLVSATMLSSQGTLGGVYNTSVQTFAEGLTAGRGGQVQVSSAGLLSNSATTSLSGAMYTEAFTTGGSACAITDANGGTYTLTDAEMANCGTFALTASGAGQAAVALTFPATSTMLQTIPNAGDCRKWYYDASAVVAGTTTTMTLGTGHNIIAYTANDDVIDGAEFAQITMCRRSDTDVNTFVTEMLHAD